MPAKKEKTAQSHVATTTAAAAAAVKKKKASTKAPKKASTKAPKKASAKAPKKASAKAPKKASVKSPVKSPAKSPVKSPAKASVKKHKKKAEREPKISSDADLLHKLNFRSAIKTIFKIIKEKDAPKNCIVSQIGSDTVHSVDSLIKDVMEKITKEAEERRKAQKRMTLMSDDVDAAIGILNHDMKKKEHKKEHDGNEEKKKNSTKKEPTFALKRVERLMRSFCAGRLSAKEVVPAVAAYIENMVHLILKKALSKVETGKATLRPVDVNKVIKDDDFKYAAFFRDALLPHSGADHVVESKEIKKDKKDKKEKVAKKGKTKKEEFKPVVLQDDNDEEEEDEDDEEDVDEDSDDEMFE